MNVLKVMLRTALVLAAVAAPVSAAAQESGALTFAAGVIADADNGSDTNGTAPFYAFSVQGIIKRHLIIEGELAHWANETVTELGPHDISGPEGVIGSVTGTRIERSSSLVNLGVNVLLRSTGRVRVFGGGGAALSWNASRFAQQSFGCSASLDPRTCERFENNRMRGPLPLFRVLGGIEASITPRVGLFGSIRYETIMWEDRDSWVAAIGGVRIAFD
jgi:hypothetical protein